MPVIFQSIVAQGRDFPRVSGCAGDVVTHRATVTLPTAGAAGDLLEIAILPARHVLVSIREVDAGTIQVAKVGIMAGDVGDTNVANRAVGTALVASGREADAAFAVTPVEYDRSIGAQLTSANAGASVTLILTYSQG